MFLFYGIKLGDPSVDSLCLYHVAKLSLLYFCTFMFYIKICKYPVSGHLKLTCN